MAHFKIIYFVWVFTVYTIINDVHSNEDLKQFIALAKRLDRGDYSGPFQLESNSFGTLNKCKQQFYKELWCSYAVSATLHMHLTMPFLLNLNYQKYLTAEEKISVLFTNEANKMLSVIYNDHQDGIRNAIGEVMWIFLMYTELVQHLFLISISRQNETNKTVLKTHDVVVKMLEEFVKSQYCKVFDPTTNQLLTDVRSLVKLKIKEDKNLQSLIRLVGQNKERVNRQNEHNRTVDERFNYAWSYTLHFSGQMLLSYMFDYNTNKVKGIENFGLQLDLTPIEQKLEHYYLIGKDVCNHLHARIGWIISFQKNFLNFMKAVAIRMVYRYLLNIKRMDNATLKEFVANNNNRCKFCNTKMIEHLNSFVEYFNLTNDEHLRSAISVLSNPSANFSDGNFIDVYVNNLLELLKEISSEDMRFDKPMKVDEENSKQTMDDVQSIVRKYRFPKPAVEWPECAVNESIYSAQVLVKYVTHELTSNADFKTINLFIQLETSESFRRLKELENNDPDNLIVL